MSKELAVLLRQRVARLRQDLHERRFVELVERRDDRQAPDEFRDQAELDQVLGLDVVEQVVAMHARVRLAHVRDETDAALLRAVHDDLFEPAKRTAADEQDVRRVDLQEFLLRMLATTLRRHRCNRALDQLEQACWTPSPDTSRVIDGLSTCARSCRSRRCRRCPSAPFSTS
jgi:hypothetical protein